MEPRCKASLHRNLTYNQLQSIFSIFVTYQYSWEPMECVYTPVALEFMIRHVQSVLNDMKTLGTMTKVCVEEFKQLYELGV